VCPWCDRGAEHSSLLEVEERARVLAARGEQLEAENAQLRAKLARMAEESNMEKFRCQLLVEMVRRGAFPLSRLVCLADASLSLSLVHDAAVPSPVLKLALATLDEERSRTEAEQEKARASSLKDDVVALLEQARKDGVDVRRLAGSLPVVGSDRP
jgi:cell division protein FtsB